MEDSFANLKFNNGNLGISNEILGNQGFLNSNMQSLGVLHAGTPMTNLAGSTASSHFHNQSRSSNGSIDQSSCWNIDQRDISQPGATSTAGTLTATSFMDGNSKSSGFNTTFSSSIQTNDSIETLKLELQLRETQIESLEKEIQKLKSVFNQGLTFKQQMQKLQPRPRNLSVDSSIEIPANLEVIFNQLSTSLKAKNEELDETKKRLESIITAISLNPSNSVTKFGRYDEEAMAHKVIVRLETLTRENQEMAKMLSYGRSKEIHIELELLKRENVQLKETLEKLKRDKK